MFASNDIEKALRLQAQSYQFLKWMTGLEQGYVGARASHGFSQLRDASHAWVENNHEFIPNAMRPDREDLRAFANLFATYLESSFDLVESPGQRLYSEDAHCFCPMCSWLVDIPNLQPKRVSPFDKRRAKKLQADFVRSLASRISVGADTACERLLTDPALREDIALGTWVEQLFLRMKGVSPGPAVLALWRAFTWTPAGSPKKKFQVTPELVDHALQRLQSALVDYSEESGKS